MSIKTLLAAALLAATASTAIAQTAQPTQQNQSTTPPRTTTTTPAAPAQAPAQAPAAQRPATTAPAAAAPAPAAQPARPAANQSQLVNLNTASKEDLDKLPQIGEARAAAIIAKRPYKDWNDFVAKGVVPSNAEAAIKDKVRFR